MLCQRRADADRWKGEDFDGNVPHCGSLIGSNTETVRIEIFKFRTTHHQVSFNLQVYSIQRIADNGNQSEKLFVNCGECADKPFLFD